MLNTIGVHYFIQKYILVQNQKQYTNFHTIYQQLKVQAILMHDNCQLVRQVWYISLLHLYWFISDKIQNLFIRLIQDVVYITNETVFSQNINNKIQIVEYMLSHNVC